MCLKRMRDHNALDSAHRRTSLGQGPADCLPSDQLENQERCEIQRSSGHVDCPREMKIGWERWGTYRGEQEGKSLAFRAEKGQEFPTCPAPTGIGSPRELRSEGTTGSRLRIQKYPQKSKAYKRYPLRNGGTPLRIAIDRCNEHR